ncbi:MAG: tRNA epoxyqueuosine(34) reductase QueG [Abditibacteriales bacterium]|nr:tRNA epoxyqueuosine(34) reductase QueG [Abditibacteriales bacterium]MDW8365742.1 tRNA epoxyqueuosine(34) reductase QueG [Abditibacteriales bacterium]
MDTLTHRIKTYARRLGFDLVGVAPAQPAAHADFLRRWVDAGMAGEMHYMTRDVERRVNPQAVLPEAKSVIVVALDYSSSPNHSTPAPPNHPTGRIARYAWGDDYHDVMRQKLNALLEFVKAEAGAEVQGKIYVDTGPVLERDIAALAGIGWFGKNTNLINTRRGSYFFLGVLLLDLALDYDEPSWTAHCGRCTACLDACPTQAFVAPYVLDARRCISYLTIELKGAIPRELRPQMGSWIFGCDVCQDVCPWNRKHAQPTDESAFFPREGFESPNLIAWLRLTPDEFRTRFKGSPLQRAKRRGLLRNIAVALGNAKDPSAVPALIDALHDEEPLVRSHAAWALGQIGTAAARQALEEAMATETDEKVREEIAWAIKTVDGSVD